MKKLLSLLIFGWAASCTPASKPTTPTSSTPLTNTRWQLIELNGSPVSADSTQRAVPHITLKANDSTFNGNTGCNTMAGTYHAQEMSRISFSKIISTKMACMNSMQMESDFLRLLEQVDNYVITGDTLVLNRARMAPLARFKAELMNNP